MTRQEASARWPEEESRPEETEPTPTRLKSQVVPRVPEPPERRSRAKTLLPALVAAAFVVTGVMYVRGRGRETTDDARVEGRVSVVSARTSGQVRRVLIEDNQMVHAGDVLVELDDRDASARLVAARADAAAARANVSAAQARLDVADKEVASGVSIAHGGVVQATAASQVSSSGIAQARAALKAAAARRTLTESELRRASRLAAESVLPAATLEARQADFDQANAAFESAKAVVRSAEAGRTNSRGSLETARGRLRAAELASAQVAVTTAQLDLSRARLEQAEAAVVQAELALSYTKIKAEVDGTIADRSVEPGQMVSPDRPLMAVVDLAAPWVVANFKENQLRDLRPGQRARVTVDAFGGREFVGYVESLAPGTGARFSLLPPDNASGNFIKVVQRVPTRLRLEPHEDVVLRPGISAVVTVFTSSAGAPAIAR